jgi:hypothetical protein
MLVLVVLEVPQHLVQYHQMVVAAAVAETDQQESLAALVFQEEAAEALVITTQMALPKAVEAELLGREILVEVLPHITVLVVAAVLVE